MVREEPLLSNVNISVFIVEKTVGQLIVFITSMNQRYITITLVICFKRFNQTDVSLYVLLLLLFKMHPTKVT